MVGPRAKQRRGQEGWRRQGSGGLCMFADVSHLGLRLDDVPSFVDLPERYTDLYARVSRLLPALSEAVYDSEALPGRG